MIWNSRTDFFYTLLVIAGGVFYFEKVELRQLIEKFLMTMNNSEEIKNELYSESNAEMEKQVETMKDCIRGIVEKQYFLKKI